MLTPEQEARLWARIDKREPDECWLWHGLKTYDGYGRLTIAGKAWTASRAVYAACVGPIPAGMVVRHSCDNPSCCNPKHLLTGTVAENIADRVARKRSASCERGGRAKLTVEIVRAIRASPAGPTQLGRLYGVDPTTVRDVKSGKNWKDVT